MKYIFLFFIFLTLSTADNVQQLFCNAEAEYPATHVNHTTVIYCGDHMYKYRTCIEKNGIALWMEVHDCDRIPLLYDYNENVLINGRMGEIIPIIHDNIDTITVTPELPYGMSINVINGKISGSPKERSNRIYTITSISGNITNNQQIRISVLADGDESRNERIKSNDNVILIIYAVVASVAVVGLIIGMTIHFRSINKRKNMNEKIMKPVLKYDQI